MKTYEKHFILIEILLIGFIQDEAYKYGVILLLWIFSCQK